MPVNDPFFETFGAKNQIDAVMSKLEYLQYLVPLSSTRIRCYVVSLF